MNLQTLRRSYRPDKVRLLFIGESPPASGRFFYNRDSGLYRALRDAFQLADPSISDEGFLQRFRASGCYLVDLCAQPVDGLDRKSRLAACRASEPRLATTIGQLKPESIATLLRSIEGNVARAISRAGWQGPLLPLPYPGRWVQHKDRFVNTLVPAIRPLLTNT